MTVYHQKTVNGYHNSVWFSENFITNIIYLSNLRLQYLVTYRSNEMILIFHRESEVKPNMQFRIHEIGLDYFVPMDQDFTFVNTISHNKEGFTPRQIKGAEVTRALCATLIYNSYKEYKWIIIPNHIKNYPVVFKDIEVVQKIWDNNIAAHKSNTTRKNTNKMTRDQVEIPV